jgi:hypothetical protein
MSSDWEGLSRVCADEFYPTPGVDDGVEAWLSGDPDLQDPADPTWPPPGADPPLSYPREYKWIGLSDPTDKWWPSWGCSILFINYLRSQLHHSLSEIIQKAGRSLAETYHNLTGEQDAAEAFQKLIEFFLPAGYDSRVQSDNPFPFLDPGHRQVFVSTNSVTDQRGEKRFSDVADVSPGGLCAKSDYRYSIFDNTATASFTAQTRGFAVPVLKWRLAGAYPTPTVIGHDHGSPRYGNPQVYEPIDVGREEPGIPGHTTWTQEKAHLASSAYGLTIEVKNLDFDGLQRFLVSAEVTEAHAYSGAITTGSEYARLETQTIEFEPRYYEERSRCEAEAHDRFDLPDEQYPGLQVWLNLPNPPPDGYMASVIGQLIHELRVLSADTPNAAQFIATGLAYQLGVPAEMLLKGPLEIAISHTEG